MYKIFLTVRNRLALTCKCLTALKKHSKLEHHVYIYENLTSTKIQQHFMYWSILYSKGLIDQVTFTNKDSTFNAFSKAVTCNMFGHQHQMDPDKNKYDFLVFLDNDIIVTPGWDEVIHQAWYDIKKANLHQHIKIVGQYPGGIKNKQEVRQNIANRKCFMGKLGGSAFWCVQPNFFNDVGFLDVRFLVGQNKKHDQHYWSLLDKSSGGKPYILGIQDRLAIHVGGKFSPSMCNILTKSDDISKIDIDVSDEVIDNMEFEEFYNMVLNDKDLANNW